MKTKKMLILCTTDSMIWNFLIPHIKRIQERGVEVECACSKTGFYFQEVKEKTGCNIHEIPFDRSPYSLKNIRAFVLLNRVVGEGGYDVIFCHEPVGGAFGRIVGHLKKCKIIYMAHGFHFYKGAPASSKIYYLAEKFLSQYTDILLTINQEDYESVKRFKAREVRKINGIGVDLSKFDKFHSDYLRSHYKINSQDFILLSVGELIPRKNHDVILEAISMLKDSRVHYFIAGEGELDSALHSKISNLGLQNQVHMLGFCRNVAELCNSCDVFVFPSRQEGLSMALMEAMACGKPVVVSRIRGNTDLVDCDKGGFLIETDDAMGYAEAIKCLMKSKKLQRQFGDYNTIKVRQFGIDTVIEQLDEVYQTI